MTYLSIAVAVLILLFLTLWLIERMRYTSLSTQVVDLAYSLKIVPIKPCSPGVALACMRDTIRDLENRLKVAQDDLVHYWRPRPTPTGGPS